MSVKNKISALAGAVVVAAVFGMGSTSFGQVTYWDNLSNATTFSGVATGSSPVAGLGNIQTGMGVNLANFTPGVSEILFLDTVIGNVTGTAIASKPVRLNVWIWETVNTTATGTAPIFSNLKDLGNGPTAPTAVFDFAPISLANNTLAETNLAFSAPFTLSSSLIGIAFNWQIDNGAGFVSLLNLNTTVIGGATQAAPAVGTNFFTASTGGYFRSANSTLDVGGNFAASSSRNIGSNSGVPFTLSIPEPSALGLLAPAGLVLARRRRA